MEPDPCLTRLLNCRAVVCLKSADSVFAAAPLNKCEALVLIGRLKTQKLLNGFRRYPPVDRDALADILVRLGDLAVAFDQIKEIDINPLIVSQGKPVAVDATIIVDKMGQ